MSGAIEDSNRATVGVAWSFAVFWNLISVPSAVIAVRQALRDESYGVLFVLIFPAIGACLLVWAIRATIRFRRFGVSRLELATVPAEVGRTLRGTVAAKGMLVSPQGMLVILTCVRRTTRGAGKNRSTSERVLWQEEQRVSGSQTRGAQGMITSIPVAFALPATAEPSDDRDRRDRVVWRLSVSADVAGVDYAATFEVPVVPTAERARGTADDPVDRPAAVVPFVQSPDSRVRVTRNRRGTEIVFPAGRTPGASVGITGFLLIWLAAVWALVHFDAPLPFQIIFGGFGALLVWIAVVSWLGMSRVTVGDGIVTVASGLVAPIRERRLQASEIAEVITKIGMQAGNTPYYDLILVRQDGKQVPAGRSIRDKREAEWLAATMREALRD